MAHLPDDPEQVRMPFGAHLEELRKRLWVSILVLAGLFLAGWLLFSNEMTAIIMRPHRLAVEAVKAAHPDFDIDERLAYFSYLEPIFFTMKASGLAALILGFPFLLYQMWLFVGVGLYPRERRAVTRYIPWSLLFAVAGVLFGYFFMIPTVLGYLLQIPDSSLLVPSLRLDFYFNLLLLLTLALAIVFQLPLILLGLNAAGLVDARALRTHRRHFILGAFIVSAVITPPDPISQVLMAVPTVLLFELSILLVSIRGRRAAEAASAGGEARA